MAQDIATVAKADRLLPAVDVGEPASMLLLPDWLASQVSAVSDLGAGRTVLDTATGQITKRVATIPKSKMPNAGQRAAIERRITELRRADRAGPDAETLSYVGDLILEYATARLDERTVKAKAGAYLDTLEDLPAWSVKEAIRRWRRGDVDADAQTLDFAPRPARLRAIAERIALVARGQAARLQRILDAEPDLELSDAEAAENLRKIYAAGRPVQDVMKPSVGSAHAHRAAANAHLSDLEARRAKREGEMKKEGADHAV